MVRIVDKIAEFEVLFKAFNLINSNDECLDEGELTEFVKTVLLDLIKIEKVKMLTDRETLSEFVDNNLKAYFEL